ncbi:global transcription factor group B1 [Actinidia rufa]|uniref:Global transcription factor group B1 n=1 Tax=Actinidia rufa TaxID=165716 RepID=A0A7J0ENW0_9ERIC|nr:global transcription factor group B1 [Actinidia rufa]
MKMTMSCFKIITLQSFIVESKEFKRLEKAQRDTGESTLVFLMMRNLLEVGRVTAEEKLKRSLFGDDKGPPLDDIAEEEEQSEEEEEDIDDEDDMADFIVDEEVDEHGARVRLCKQGLEKMGKYDGSGEWRERRLEDEFEQSQGEGELGQPLLSKRGTGTTQGEGELSINKDDIMKFWEFMHVQKLDLPFVTMYRKEECLSLLRDPEQHETDFENQNKPDQQPTIRWHKRTDVLKGAKETAEERATNFTCAIFETPQAVLKAVEICCDLGRDILSWKLCPLESFLTVDEKYGIVEQVMVNNTNQVGLDVNLAIAHEWLFSPLQLISGLGPRKAASLQRSLVTTGAIYTRKDLLTAHGLDVQDDDAIDDEDMAEMVIEHVKGKPDLLKYFEMDEYANSKKWENKIGVDTRLLGLAST